MKLKKLVLDKRDGYNYHLKDENKTYIVNIEFYEVDIDNIECIYMDNYFLEEHQQFSFGPLDEKYGRKITSSEDKDLIILKMKNGEEVYLKRFYG